MQIIVTEALHYGHRDRTVAHMTHYRLTNACSISILFVACYQLIGFFLFGLSVSQAITDIGKFTIGRLRPHFLDVCRPDMSKINCSYTDQIYAYVEDAFCLGTDKYKLVDARFDICSYIFKSVYFQVLTQK